MAKGFRYIITDLYDGSIKGTNDIQKAHDCATCEDFYVYDTVDCVWIHGDISTHELKEF